MISRFFLFVVRLATISFTWAIIVPKREAAHRKRKMQNTCNGPMFVTKFFKKETWYSKTATNLQRLGLAVPRGTS
jgi:hypothetical protein